MRRQFAGDVTDRPDFVRICVFFAMASWYAAVDENGQMQAFEFGTSDSDVDMRTYETFEDAKLLAQEILSKRLDANVGCALIASIAAKLRYPESLEVFFALAHDQSGHEHVGISAGDCVDDIFVACRVLLESSINEHHDV